MNEVNEIQEKEVVIEKSKNIDRLKKMTVQIGYDWDCEVIRIIFDRGYFKLFDIIGDIEPPKKTQCPQKTLLPYGSSCAMEPLLIG